MDRKILFWGIVLGPLWYSVVVYQGYPGTGLNDAYWMNLGGRLSNDTAQVVPRQITVGSEIVVNPRFYLWPIHLLALSIGGTPPSQLLLPKSPSVQILCSS